ncbi:MAG: hypothetical protein WAT39_26330 [Planctomycetota bacterium]
MNLHAARRSLSPFALSLLACLLADPAPCQVPAGWWISAHHVTPTTYGPAGLWLHHPTGAVPSIPVTGLSGGLLGTGLVSGTGLPTAGSASVTLCEATGTTVYVGEVVSGTDTLELHRVTLAGTTAIADVVVGTIPTYPGTIRRISSLATTDWSPGSEPYILMTIAGQPAGYPQLAVYQTMTGLNIVPTLYGMPMGTATAVAYTDSYPGTTIAVVYAGTTTIVTVNITFGSASYQVGPVTTLATIPASVAAMDFEPSTGLIYCACDSGPALYTVDASTGAVTALGGGGARRGVAWDAETGTIASVGTGFAAFGTALRSTVGGFTTVATAPPVGGWSTPSAVDVRAAVRVIEAGPAGMVDLRWNTPWTAAAAGVANLPLSGNAGWGLSVSPTILAPITAFVGVSLAPSPFPIPLGMPPQFILIDLSPGSFLGILPVSGFGVAALPFPIPAGFAGAELWFQAVCSVATVPDPILTDALQVTIL